MMGRLLEQFKLFPSPVRRSLRTRRAEVARLQFLAARLGAAFNTQIQNPDEMGIWTGRLDAEIGLRFSEGKTDGARHFYSLVQESTTLGVANPGGVMVIPNIPSHWPPLMARGLYKMGEEDFLQKLENHFGPLLSFHDKLACRDEMPIELWPANWKS